MTLPQWSTSQRRKHLIELFRKYGNQCLQGHPVCPHIKHYNARNVKMEWMSEGVRVEGRSKSGDRTGIFRTEWKKRQAPVYSDYPARLYNKMAEGAIESWKAEDRERRSYEWKLEQQQILDGTYGKYGSTFDPVARDVYVNDRPEYYLVGMGVSPFNFKRVALIRIPSTHVHLFVEVGSAAQEVSKNARRKAKRYGKVSGLYNTIEQTCKAAVADWWASR